MKFIQVVKRADENVRKEYMFYLDFHWREIPIQLYTKSPHNNL